MADSPVARAWDAHIHVFDARVPVRGSHYVPATRALPEVEAAAAPLGISRFVLVQPSVYGTDNSLMLHALGQSRGRHRGVVVLDPRASDTTLDAMHAAGVRGARFNLVSPVGNAASDLDALAPRLAQRGWHAQWYVASSQLPQLVESQRRTQLTFVLDHLAGLNLQSPESDWIAAAELARSGAWIKLSGWYRLGAQPPYADLVPLIARAASLFGDRMVWGSDWPHTSLADTPPYASLLAPVQAALGPESMRKVLRENPQRLYAEPISQSK